MNILLGFLNFRVVDGTETTCLVLPQNYTAGNPSHENAPRPCRQKAPATDWGRF